jgi:glycosyltransferase involved in cell wall biosynthesis
VTCSRLLDGRPDDANCVRASSVRPRPNHALTTDAHASGVRVGIIIPAYNAAPWIADAIRSVLAQSHPDWRLVVVDDGSTDTTTHIIASFSDPRISQVRQANAGVSAARNRGISELRQRDLEFVFPLASREAAGRSVLFLDADDRLAPDALSRLTATLDSSPASIAAVGAYTIPHTRCRRPPSGDLLPGLLVRNLFANGGHVLIRSEALCATGSFRTDIAYGEDWEFWIRLAMQGPFAATGEPGPVLYIRQHDTGAYRRLATDPDSFTPCMDAIFGNSALLARFGAKRLAAIRRRAEAENIWIIGRELLRHGRTGEGRVWLRRSLRAAPSLKRMALLAASLLPIGPFVPYTADRHVP